MSVMCWRLLSSDHRVFFHALGYHCSLMTTRTTAGASSSGDEKAVLPALPSEHTAGMP